jgi:hypothetical protein
MRRFRQDLREGGKECRVIGYAVIEIPRAGTKRHYVSILAEMVVAV